jgi:hypothetical protein
MNAEGATPASLGFGIERHIQRSRAATDSDAKVEHLTCALEALLLHLKHLEVGARDQREAAPSIPESAEAESAG